MSAVRTVIAFVSQVLVMSVLVMIAEYLLPSGRIKNAACVAARLTYIAAICDEIIGIFAGLGV